jgi:hypothetical protein
VLTSMSMEIVITTGRWKNDPDSRSLVEYLRENEVNLKLTEAILYYDFPAYTDYEAVLNRPDVLLFSPKHGFLAVRFFESSQFKRSQRTAKELDLALSDFASNLYSRLLRSRELRLNRNKN